MKIGIIALIGLSVLTITAQAEYNIKIPMEEGLINFKSKPKPIEKWEPVDAIYSNWSQNGAIYDCNWTPASSTVLKDDSLTQTATSCKQDQTRTKQEREQEVSSLEYRNVGMPITETKTNTIPASGNNSIRTITGTANCLYLNSRLKESYWLSGYNGNYVVYVNGAMIASGNGYGMSSVYSAGKLYNRGTTVKETTNGYPMYEVCK